MSIDIRLPGISIYSSPLTLFHGQPTGCLAGSVKVYLHTSTNARNSRAFAYRYLTCPALSVLPLATSNARAGKFFLPAIVNACLCTVRKSPNPHCITTAGTFSTDQRYFCAC